jgi:hypothetical protein
MIRTGLTILAGAIFALCPMAQAQTSPPPNPQTPTPQTSASPNASAQPATNPAIPNGPAVTAELNGSVDSKKAKVGDKVEAHTTEALKNGNDVLVPKGTKLLGHITQATARSKGDNDSSLAIQFDKAVPKKEAEIPLSVMILAVAPPAQQNSGSSSPSPADPLAGTNTGAQTSPMGGSHPSSPNPAAYPTTGGQDASPETANTAALPANSRGIYGLKDLKLMMSKPEGGTATTIITSGGKDVHLDSGTRLLLVTTATASAALGQ